MSPSRRNLPVVGIIAAIGIAAASTFVIAAATSADLGNNEGVFVEKGTFKMIRGTAKSDPAALIVSMGAKEVAEGAIIFRSGEKLYIVDGKPASDTPQAMNSFAAEVWGQQSRMKGFDKYFSPN